MDGRNAAAEENIQNAVGDLQTANNRPGDAMPALTRCSDCVSVPPEAVSTHNAPDSSRRAFIVGPELRRTSSQKKSPAKQNAWPGILSGNSLGLPRAQRTKGTTR